METADVEKGSGDLFGTHPAVNNLLYFVHLRPEEADECEHQWSMSGEICPLLPAHGH